MKRYLYFILMLLLSINGIYGQSLEFDPSNPPEPNALHSLNLQVSPNGAGSFSGTGKYAAGTSIRVYAYNTAGFRFKSWTENGNVISTSSSFYYVMPSKDVTLTAVFEYDPDSPAEPNPTPLKYVLNLAASPNVAGSFNISSGNRHQAGSSVYLYAYTNTGFRFREWRDGEQVLSANRNFYYTMPGENKTLTAVYDYDPDAPSEPNTPTGVEHGLIALTQSGEPGQQIAYPIYLLNHNIDVYSAEFDIAFPGNAVFDYQNAVLSGRINGHILSISQTDTSLFHVSVLSESWNPFFDSNGILLTMPVTLPVNWNQGESHPVTIGNVVLGTASGTIASIAKNGTLSVTGTADHSVYASFYPTKFLNRVLFSNLSSETATDFLWDFGDGNTSTEREPLHTYASSGHYEVQLKAYNAYTSDSAKIDVDINPENYWNASGVLSLNKHKKEVKSFSSLEELFLLLSRTTLIGDVTIQTEAGETFEIPLSAISSDYVTNLKSKIKSGNHAFTFSKDGNGNNPALSITGNILEISNYLDNIKDLFSVLTLNEVDLLLFGIRINLSQLDQYRGESLCSGNTTQAVDFSSIGGELNYSWTMVGEPQNLTGYQVNGTGNIPAMTIVNTSSQKATLTYVVAIKWSTVTLFESEYSITVLPTLSGTISNLFPNNNEEVSSPEVTLSWDAIENALYDLFLWETGTEMPDMPFVAGLSSFRYTNNSYCQYGKSYTWKVVARNECARIESATAQFRVRELPDLHVTAVNFSDAFAGKTLTVSWKVKNDGTGSTGTAQWSDHIWLIPDIYTGTTNECRLLKSVANLSALIPGQEYENSTEITLPERLSGNFYIAVLSDMYDIQSIDWTPAGNTVPNPYTPDLEGSPYPYLKAVTSSSYYNKVEEIGESANVSDNFFYKQIDIQIPPLPDVQVRSVVAQDNTYSGQNMQVDVVVANKGEADILYTGSWAVALYISKNAEFDETALLLNYRYEVMPLTVDEDKTIQFTVKTPIDYHGEVYFFAVADHFDHIYEHAKENNNTERSNAVNIILTPPADLAPASVVIPSAVSTGATFEIKATVMNKGAGKPNKTNWTDRIYLSRNGTQLDQSAIQIASHSRYESLNPGSSYQIIQNIQLPDVTEGDYFVYIHTDVYDNVFELEKQNNVYRLDNTINVVKPDLTVSWGNMAETLTSGKLENLHWIVKNNAPGEVKDKEIKDYFYLSKSVNGTNPVYLTDYTHQIRLTEGQEKSNYLNVTIPYNPSLGGKCYLFVQTDNNNRVIERYETNNTATYEFTYQYIPLPDLTLSNLSVGGTIVPGELLSVSYRLSNIGALNITDESYPVNIYISKRQTFDQQAVQCEVVQQIQPDNNTGKQIEANAYTDFVQQIRVPAGIQGGSSYLHIIANEGAVLKEINTGNNQAVASIFISGNLPALKVASAAIPENVLSGVPMECEWSVANNGQIAAVNFTDAMYISSDNVLNGGDERLYFSENNSLQPGDAYSRKVSVSIPDKWHGERYILIVTNENRNLQEEDYTDNAVAVPITVNLSPLPDLEVTAITAETTARSGQSYWIQYEVANTGEHKTRQDKWTDEFYLSAGTALDKTRDYFLGKKLRIGALETGETYNDSIEVTIPSEASGNYNLTVYTDAGDVVFEADPTNNSKQRSVAVYRPLPCDLIIEGVNAPATIIPGRQVEISWTVKNNSNYPMEGTLSDAIYFSKDRTWDISDYYVSSVQSDMELLPGQAIEQKMYGLINRVPEGEYYVIIKTNQQNNVIESDYENNATAADVSSTVLFEALDANSSKQVDTKIKYYKLEVDESLEGQTLAVRLAGDGNKKDIGLYVAHNAIPTVAVYDFSSTDPMRTEQEAVVPSLKRGTYYLMVQDKQEIIKVVARYPKITYKPSVPSLPLAGVGRFLGGVGVVLDYNSFWGTGSFIPNPEPEYFKTIYHNESPLSLSTKVLQFEISSVSDNKGANAGSVTSAVSGAKFDSIMDFRLRTPDGFIPAEAVYVENQSAAWVTFNLKETPTGDYDVEAELPVNLTTLKENGYSVIPGVSSQLYTKIVIPASIRINTKIPFSIEFANAGNTDVKVSELLLVSENGHPIGLNTQELDSAYTEIRIPIGGIGNNKAAHVLPPGARGTKTVFLNTNNLSNIRLRLYIIKQDY